MRFYITAGRLLCIQSLDQWSATLADRFASAFYLEPAPGHHTSAEVAYTIRISASEPVPPVPADLRNFEIAFGCCYTDGQSYYLQVEDSLVVIGLRATKTINVWIGDTTRAKLPLSLDRVLSYALEAALRRCGLYQCHGAGLSAPAGDLGALILGASGSGKSTLTMQLIASGWGYLTDDMLLLEDEAGVVQARGIRRFFAASETTLAACSSPKLESALGARMLSDFGKRRLDPHVAFPSKFVESCVPRALFFASVVKQAETSVIKLRSGEAMARLIRFNPWASYDTATAREHLSLLSLLVKQCQAYALRAGLDVLNNPEQVDTIFTACLKEHGTGER